VRVRLAQPAENLSPYRVGKRFVDRVDIERHVGQFLGHQQPAGVVAGWRLRICIATKRIVYRNLTICMKPLLAMGSQLTIKI
jgi:hypothetical protein